MPTTGRIFSNENQDLPENFCAYTVGPLGNLVDSRHSERIRELLKKMEGPVNRHFSTRKTGAVRYRTEDYTVYISRAENSLIVHVKNRKTGRVLLAHRIRTGEPIIV